MTAFATRTFARWARKQGFDDASLLTAVSEMEQGLIDADLGGGLVKKRIARPGQGKRGGFRTLVATNRSDRWFFVYGFAKNERDNIDQAEEKALKRLASQLLELGSDELRQAVAEGALTEIEDG